MVKESIESKRYGLCRMSRVKYSEIELCWKTVETSRVKYSHGRIMQSRVE